MPRCTHCDKYCSSEGGLSNHLNACKQRKRKRQAEHDIEVDRAIKRTEEKYEALLGKLKGNTYNRVVHNTVNIHNRVVHNQVVHNKFTLNKIVINQYTMACQGLAKNIGTWVQDPRAKRLINNGQVTQCVEYIRQHIKDHGQPNQKLLLQQLESGDIEFEHDGDEKQTLAKIEDQLDKVDHQIVEAIASQILEDDQRKKFRGAYRHKSVFSLAKIEAGNTGVHSVDVLPST